MSVVKLNEYTPTSYRNEQSKMLAERTQVLINISKKAREESLTLQETNDLYAEFNKTYDLSNNAGFKSKISVEVVKVEEPVSSTKTLSPTNTLSAIKKTEPLNTVGLDGVDESWALKLLKESELEEGKSKLRDHQPKYTRTMIQPVLCEA